MGGGVEQFYAASNEFNERFHGMAMTAADQRAIEKSL
jgi:hypothetical protein